jgi:hypothetical protein
LAVKPEGHREALPDAPDIRQHPSRRTAGVSREPYGPPQAGGHT